MHGNFPKCGRSDSVAHSFPLRNKIILKIILLTILFSGICCLIIFVPSQKINEDQINLVQSSASISNNNISTNSSNNSTAIYMEYYYQPGCSLCIEKEAVIDCFLMDFTVNYTKIAVLYGVNESYYYSRLNNLRLPRIGTPGVIFLKEDYAIGLGYSKITYDQLKSTYYIMVNYTSGGINQNLHGDEITPWISFVSGVLTGLSPCIILILAVVTPSFSAEKLNKSQFVKIFSGLSLGIICMYILLGLIIIGTFEALANLIYLTGFKWILGGIMIGLGIWYILDSFSEKSKLFSTPDLVKKFVSKMLRKGSFIYGFILGFIFSLIKIPCIGAIMISLFMGLVENPIFFALNLGFFYLGLILPLIIVLILLLRGSESEKINQIRIKYRPILRILSGVAIIGLTFYSLLGV
ncbi:MAG: sulfite exporter TauE/SafE family protein [Candidatus Lokiarchaeota archaeon]|nr:sulfite exporter TauE/SafE family protein [Candidatus Harpocratesius repetitus]